VDIRRVEVRATLQERIAEPGRLERVAWIVRRHHAAMLRRVLDAGGARANHRSVARTGSVG
jgi:hypothetical protein